VRPKVVVIALLVGMLLVVVVLCGLLTLGRTGGLAAPTILLGTILFALQVIDLEIPSSALALASEGAASLFLVLLCTVLLIGLFGPGRITVNRIIGCGGGLLADRPAFLFAA
jgi:hypothetical protein